MSEPITDIEQLTNERLTGVLRREGFLNEGCVVSFDVKHTRTLLISKVFHLSITSASLRVRYNRGGGCSSPKG